MSNVLPKNAQKEVWSFYRSRFLLVGSIAALTMAAATFLALLPSYIAVRTGGTLSGSSQNDLPELGEAEKERADMFRARSLTEELGSVVEQSSTFDALMETLMARPNGISVQKIQISELENKHTLVISGSASDRAQVSTYRSALSKISQFESVAVPVGALAGAGGGQFSITITGTF